MTVNVKICGVRTPAVLQAAISAGAGFIGLVFFDKSPRNLTLAEASELASSARCRAKTVAVLVDPDDALIDAVAVKVRPDVLQLHGNEPPDRVADIKARNGLPVFKAVPVSEAADVALADRYRGIADRIIFDTKAPAGAALPGGNGVAFDWGILDRAERPFALSGGLDAGNVARAIALSGASLVDVSSGVETAPGTKDAALISQFVQAAQSAEAQHKKAS